MIPGVKCAQGFYLNLQGSKILAKGRTNALWSGIYNKQIRKKLCYGNYLSF